MRNGACLGINNSALVKAFPVRSPADMGSGNALEVCKQLLREFRIPADMYQIGRTKLFFRAGVLGHLEDTSARLNRCDRAPAHPQPRNHVHTSSALMWLTAA